MSTCVRTSWSIRAGAALMGIGVSVGSALAQSTVVLQTPGTQVTDTYIRGGSYADTTHAADLLVTRASDNPGYERRALLKFETNTSIPAGSVVQSATLTVTVAGGNPSTRRVAAYQVTNGFEATQANWIKRTSSSSWTTAGGDLGIASPAVTVTEAPGIAVTFDVTGLVQSALSAPAGERNTRIALMDVDPASRSSWRQYHSAEAADPLVRPKLVVQYIPEQSATTGSVQLKVLQWNTHHGTDENGTYNLDLLATWMASFNPDLISLNEVEKFTSWGNEDQPYRYKTLLQEKTGKTWYYHFAAKSTDPGKGSLILSTYPFVSTTQYQLPYIQPVAQVSIVVNGRTINFMSTHFDAWSKDKRLTQANDLVAYAAGFAQQRIIAGDLNAWPSGSCIDVMSGAYYDSWDEAAANGTAVSYPGRESGQTRKGRIDYVFYSKNATELVLQQVQVLDTRNSDGVMASDHAPVMATFDVQ